ncbi:hypothetical protein ODJ79_28905 [Actinoplanes sp. KI2]|uniref:hypothetical protein n=1 Tax=Actinoplanes sp. KI2 TaxID=2983315 RepID=UPI0021D5AB8B|nr:hypothetical protein [Actinoplanes sp. KI2]MCU7727757.1 hypothetical protein [Actinoplanes sp. KI2]
MPAQPTTSSAAKWRWFITVLIAMVILAVLAGIALSRLHHADAATGLGAGPAASTQAAAGTTSVPTPQATTHSSPTVPTRKVTVSAAPTTAAPAGPVIAYFRVGTKPSCPSGTNQVQYPGQPVVLEWKVRGADKTTLSVDGPGIYNEYAAEDSATLNFPCSGDPGTYQTHTYTLRAIGPDGTTSRKLTVQAKVNEIATT